MWRRSINSHSKISIDVFFPIFVDNFFNFQIEVISVLANGGRFINGSEKINITFVSQTMKGVFSKIFVVTGVEVRPEKKDRNEKAEKGKPELVEDEKDP